MRTVAIPAVLFVCSVVGVIGCGESDSSTSSSLETQVAETAAAQQNQCEMLAIGEGCLARFLICLGDADPRSEEGAACREEVKDCLPTRPPGHRGPGGAHRPPPPEGVEGDAGLARTPADRPDGGACDGGPPAGGELAEGAPEGGRRHGGGAGAPAGLPPPVALTSCREELSTCLASASDESACLEPLRSCLRAAFTEAFTEMCTERVAACAGSSDARCAELVSRCDSGGPAACIATDA